MAHGILWTLVITGVLTLGVLIYWQLVIAEGAYLGQWMVTRLYDLTARRYDEIKQFDHEMEAAFLGRPLARALQDLPSPLVLDIATGTARLPLALFEQPTFQGRIIGIDNSRKMLSITAQKTRDYASQIDLIWKDAAHLPFPDGTFDVVTCLEMIEFTPDPEKQLAEAVQVLRPGGILLTTRRRGFDARLMPRKTHSRDEFTALLKRLGLIHIHINPWQVDYDLALSVLEGNAPRGAQSLSGILRCPHCDVIAFERQNQTLQCGHCRNIYPICEGVIELRD